MLFRSVDEVSEALKKRGFSSEGIHGDLTQAKRDTVIRQFREKTIDILVATDVAARGLDISGVTHVYNYDLPQDPESYVHRVGRTGRAGNTGEAMTFVIPRETEHLRAIERLIKRRIPKRKAPSFSEALEGAQQAAIRNLVNAAEEANVDNYRANAEELLANFDSVVLVSAAIKLITKEPDQTPVKITEEAPLRVARRFNGRSSSPRRRDDSFNKGHRPHSDHSHGDRSHRNGPSNDRPKHHSHDAEGSAAKTRRSSSHNSSERPRNKVHKEPNRSVFKPYFKE